MPTPKFLKRQADKRITKPDTENAVPSSLVNESVFGVVFAYNPEHQRDELLSSNAVCFSCHKVVEGQAFVRVRGIYLAYVECPACGRSEFLITDLPKHSRFIPA